MEMILRMAQHLPIRSARWSKMASTEAAKKACSLVNTEVRVYVLYTRTNPELSQVKSDRLGI
jgi:hypothetical protein